MVSLVVLNALLFDMSFLDPVNMDEEKKKFFGSDSYNPVFEYKKIDFPADSFRTNLEQMLLSPQNEDIRISQMIQDTAREDMLLIDLLKARGTQNFGVISEQIFPAPSKRMISKAKEVLDNIPKVNSPNKDPSKEKKVISSEEMAKRLREAIKELSLPHRIFIEKISSRVKIDNIRQKVIINSDEMFSERDVTKIVAHELKGHAIRFRNGSLQKWELFKAGTARYIETEEGLAKLSEEEEGCLDTNTSAALLLAVNIARAGSFREVFDDMRSYFSEEKAFKIALRVKRGMGDTSLAGAYTKDGTYFSGYLKLKELSEEDIKILRAGRVAMQYLPVLKELVREKRLKIF